MAYSPKVQLELLPDAQEEVSQPVHSWNRSFWQVVRFGIVGVLNSIIDVLTLNLLLLRFPTHDANLLLVYNSVAYTLGALNSFMLNKYWTFRRRQAVSRGEVLRFAIVSVIGILCNDSIIWIMARTLHPLIANTILWANASKGSAVIGNAIVSYLGMRLWVFASASQEHRKKREKFPILATNSHKQVSSAHPNGAFDKMHVTASKRAKNGFLTPWSLSVVLPAYNEEEIIATTVHTIVATLIPWVQDFEVIVVNDGSKDNTGTIVKDIAAIDPHVRLINHPINQGYGATLVSGFEAFTKDLVFFTDSDGQFDICDLEPFFPLIEKYDAVLGYRIDRQDTWVRKLNAWGWKMLIRFVFGVHVRDVDCAFKLYRADFFRKHRLETRGAMINAEILYKLKRFGYTYREVGVHHLPRRSGRATGAKLSVIVRALRESITFAWKWQHEERKEKVYDAQADKEDQK